MATVETALVDLARRAADGDLLSLEALLVALHPRIRRFYRRWLFSWHDRDELADDLAQEALWRIAQNVSRCDAADDARFVSWCLVLARNLGIDFLRSSQGAWALVTFVEELRNVSGVPAPRDEPPSAGHQILLRLLERAQAAEPEAIQTLLWHRVIEGLSWEETASALSTSASAAKRAFQRAQVRLRTHVLEGIRHLGEVERAAVEAVIESLRTCPAA